MVLHNFVEMGLKGIAPVEARAHSRGLGTQGWLSLAPLSAVQCTKARGVCSEGVKSCSQSEGVKGAAHRPGTMGQAAGPSQRGTSCV